MRVLIVEDEEFLADAIREGTSPRVDRRGHRGDGCRPLEMAERNAYDVIVLDRDLPRLSGDEVAADSCRTEAPRASSCSPQHVASTTRSAGSSSALTTT